MKVIDLVHEKHTVFQNGRCGGALWKLRQEDSEFKTRLYYKRKETPVSFL